MASTIYERPDLYEAAFSYRDLSREVDFLLAVLRRHGRKNAPHQVLDIAAGPGPHAGILVRRGVHVTLVDNSHEMLARATNNLQTYQHLVDVVEADMRNFIVSRNFDMAICMLDSLGHISQEADLRCHLQCVAGALVEGGLYVLELSVADEQLTKSAWSIHNEGEEVAVEWGERVEWLDKHRRIGRFGVRITSTRSPGVSDEVIMRGWTIDELANVLASLPELRLVEVYGDFDLNCPAGPAGWRLLPVLKRVS